MDTAKTISYKGWVISAHCQAIQNDGRPVKYTAMAMLSSDMGYSNRQSGCPPSVVHFAGTMFDSVQAAMNAVFTEAKNEIDADSTPPM